MKSSVSAIALLLSGLAATSLTVAGGNAVLAQSSSAAKRSLIVHADDAGMSHSANMATIEGMEKGIVTSASILVPCAWFPEFAKYAHEHPDGDYGVHLTLTCEWEFYRWGPAAPRDKVPSLLDGQGYLFRGNESVVAKVKRDEAETELRAQIDRALQFGIQLSHLDTHMGTLLDRSDLLDLYVQLGIEYKLPIMFTRQATDPRMERAYPGLRGRGRDILDLLDSHHMPVLSSVLMFYIGGDHEVRTRRYLDAFQHLPEGVTQLIVHCGVDNAELSAITSSAALRDSDRRFVTDPKAKAELDRLGVTLTNWKKFQASTAPKK